MGASSRRLPDFSDQIVMPMNARTATRFFILNAIEITMKISAFIPVADIFSHEMWVCDLHFRDIRWSASPRT
jgi:hypothetical protein